MLDLLSLSRFDDGTALVWIAAMYWPLRALGRAVLFVWFRNQSGRVREDVIRLVQALRGR